MGGGRGGGGGGGGAVGSVFLGAVRGLGHRPLAGGRAVAVVARVTWKRARGGWRTGGRGGWRRRRPPRPAAWSRAPLLLRQRREGASRRGLDDRWSRLLQVCGPARAGATGARGGAGTREGS
ncbi:hypothetical protein ABZP36_027497 [Zizania latifolia]